MNIHLALLQPLPCSIGLFSALLYQFAFICIQLLHPAIYIYSFCHALPHIYDQWAPSICPSVHIQVVRPSMFDLCSFYVLSICLLTVIVLFLFYSKCLPYVHTVSVLTVISSLCRLVLSLTCLLFLSCLLTLSVIFPRVSTVIAFSYTHCVYIVSHVSVFPLCQLLISFAQFIYYCMIYELMQVV